MSGMSVFLSVALGDSVVLVCGACLNAVDLFIGPAPGAPQTLLSLSQGRLAVVALHVSVLSAYYSADSGKGSTGSTRPLLFRIRAMS